MRYGVREIANVMLKAKVDGQKIGNQAFAAGQPVCHFSSLKTSTVEGAATTVYATGGRGNSRLIAWEGERTLTLTMEDALISPMGIAILTGAGLIESTETTITTHVVEVVDGTGTAGSYTYATSKTASTKETEAWAVILDGEGNPTGRFYPVTITGTAIAPKADYQRNVGGTKDLETADSIADTKDAASASGWGYSSIMVDYYTDVTNTKGVTQIDIEPGKFGGNYYLEAETLFRDESTGRDDAAEFILPNCKIQSNFTFAMASSGDPSTFTFTVDAFPGVIKGGSSKKVLCAIQIMDSSNATGEVVKDDFWLQDED